MWFFVSSSSLYSSSSICLYSVFVLRFIQSEVINQRVHLNSFSVDRDHGCHSKHAAHICVSTQKIEKKKIKQANWKMFRKCTKFKIQETTHCVWRKPSPTVLEMTQMNVFKKKNKTLKQQHQFHADGSSGWIISFQLWIQTTFASARIRYFAILQLSHRLALRIIIHSFDQS